MSFKYSKLMSRKIKTMKKGMYLLISLLLISYNMSGSMYSVTGNRLLQGDSLSVICTPDLFNLSARLAGEYNRNNSGAKIKVKSVSDLRTAEILIKEGNIGFVSGELYAEFENESLWKVVIGRDVTVPVMNSKNPFSELIFQQGISPEALTTLLNSPASYKWGTLLKNSENTPVKYYWINDKSVKKGVAGFLKTDQINTTGEETGSSEELISAIQSDPYAIGFCKMTSILNSENQNIIQNIRLLPIDRNGNGIIDSNEKIYDDYNVFSRGVWIGKYPKSLINNIYSVSSDQPKNETETAFIKWILTDGQAFLYGNGLTDLLVTERVTSVDKLYTSQINAGTVSPGKNLKQAILIFIVVLIVTGLVADASIRYLRNRKGTILPVGPGLQTVLDENSLIVPKGLYFAKTHTWAFMEQNGIVKVGIDDFLQHITGPLTRIKMLQTGGNVKKGEKIVSIIQNGKQLNLYSPVSGTIVEQNKSLESDASKLNSAPYTDGWIYRIEPTNWLRENQLLFMAEKHKLYIRNEFIRLKDFLAVALKEDMGKYGQIVLQDGGELRDGVLSNLGPEEWEDFQTKFIDPSRQLWFYEII
jgi:glycine cleavage system H lipoate-binding protein/ABC-type phosphate transport system substrate-binding protein